MFSPSACSPVLPVALPSGPRARVLAFPRSAQQRAAFEAVVCCHHAALRACAQRLCRTKSDADDLVQDTLERAFAAFSDFHGDASPKTWLLVIMRHLFLDQCRRRARVRCAGDLPLLALPAPVPDVPETWRTVGSEQLEQALAQIEVELRRAFLLRWKEHRSYREIADALAIPLNTVGTRLLRARRAIRDLLDTAEAAQASG